MAKIEATVDNIRDITQRIKEGRGTVGKFVSDDALAARIDDLGTAVKDLSAIMAAIRRGEGAIGSLTMEGGDAQLAIADFKESAASLRRVTARLESSDGLVGKLLNDTAYSKEVAENIRASAAHLSSIMKKIDEGQGTLGALVNERTLYDGAEEVFAGVNDSKFARWMMRHYQKKGIEAPSPSPSPSPKP
jgi:phospholipid/cholesterol/gamma-HCH transport system substrate-binding protein